MKKEFSVSRRGVLHSMALMAGSAVLPTQAAAPLPLLEAAPAAAQPRLPLRVLLQRSPVAGFQYHDGEGVWSSLRAGDPLALVREPHNPYDARAVRLEWEGHKIGYVPAMENVAISQLLDRDEGLDAVIVQLQEAPGPWDRVAFAVYLTMAA